MKADATSHRRLHSRARRHSLHALAAALLLGGCVAPARADILYVTLGNNTIEKITSAGSGSVFASSGLSNPFGLAFDSAGNLYTANDTGSTIRKFTSSGSGSVFVSSGLSGPIGLAFDGAGTLYAGSNSGIAMIDSGGTVSPFASSGVNLPWGLAFDSAGNLYAANVGDNTIEKYTPGGAGSVFANSGLSSPRGMVFDAVGNLYVANATSNTIKKFTPGGAGSVFASTGTGTGPVGLAFDSAGNLYAAYGGNSTIEKFSPTGTDLGVFANSTNGISSSPRFLAFTTDAGVPLPLANGYPVPEPTTCALLLFGGLGMLATRRRAGFSTIGNLQS